MAPLYAGWMMYQGRVTRKLLFLFLFWLGEIAASCVFEMIGTGVDVFTYYGPYELRIWNYPLVIGVLEGTQTILFTVLAVNIWRRVKSGWSLFGLIPADPARASREPVGLGTP